MLLTHRKLLQSNAIAASREPPCRDTRVREAEMDEYCGAGTENHPLGFRANRMNRKIRINFPVNDIDWRDLRVLINGAYPALTRSKTARSLSI
jgi:hypothetical protein